MSRVSAAWVQGGVEYLVVPCVFSNDEPIMLIHNSKVIWVGNAINGTDLEGRDAWGEVRHTCTTLHIQSNSIGIFRPRNAVQLYISCIQYG